MEPDDLAVDHSAVAEDLALQLLQELRKVKETGVLIFEESEWIEKRTGEVRRLAHGLAIISDRLEMEGVKQKSPQIPLTETTP